MSGPEIEAIKPVINQDRFNQYVYNQSKLESAKEKGTIWKLKIEDGQVVEKTNFEFITSWFKNLLSPSESNQISYELLSKQVKNLDPKVIQIRGREYIPTLQDMKMAKVSEEEMTRVLTHSKLTNVIKEKAWTSISAHEVENVHRTIGTIAADNLPRLKKKFNSLYTNAAEIGHRYRAIIDEKSSPELVLGKRIIVANSTKVDELRNKLYQEYAEELLNDPDLKKSKLNEEIIQIKKSVKAAITDPSTSLQIDSLLVKRAVKLARDNFPEFFSEINEDLSNLSPDSYAFRLISDILYAQPVNQGHPDIDYLKYLHQNLDHHIKQAEEKHAKNSDKEPISQGKLIDEVLNGVESLLIPPKRELKQAISNYIQDYVSRKSNPSERVKPFVNYFDDSMLSKAANEVVFVNNRLAENISNHKVDLIRNQIRGEFEGNLLNNYKAIHRVVELARENYPTYFQSVKSDLSDLKVDSPAYKILSQILGDNWNVDEAQVVIQDVLKDWGNRDLSPNDVKELVRAKLDAQRNKANTSNVQLLLFEYIDTVSASNPARLKQAFQFIVDQHPDEVELFKPLNEETSLLPLLKLNENPRIRSLLALRESNLEQKNLSHLNALTIAGVLHSYFADQFNKGENLNNAPSIAQYGKALALIERFMPDIYQSIGNTRDQRPAAAVIARIIWGDIPPLGAVDEAGNFRYEGYNSFEQNYVLRLPEGQTFVEFYVKDLDFGTRENAERYINFFRNLPYRELQQAGVTFPVNENEMGQIKIGDHTYAINLTYEGRHQLYLDSTISETPQVLGRQLEYLMEHFANNIKSFESIDLSSVNDISQIKQILNLYKKERSYNFDSENIEKLFAIPENDKQAILRKAGNQNSELVLAKAQQLRNFYILQYIIGQNKFFSVEGALRQYTRDNINGVAMPVILPTGEQLFKPGDPTEKIEHDARSLRDLILKSFENINKRELDNLILNNQRYAAANGLKAAPSYEEFKALFESHILSQNGEARLKLFLKGLKIEEDRLLDLSQKTGLSKEEIEGLLYHQYMKFMLVCSQALMNLPSYAPLVQSNKNTMIRYFQSQTNLDDPPVPVFNPQGAGVLYVNDDLTQLNAKFRYKFISGEFEGEGLSTNMEVSFTLSPNSPISMKSKVDSDNRISPAGLKRALNKENPVEVVAPMVDESISKQNSASSYDSKLQVIIEP